MKNLARRFRDPELMDDPACPAGDLHDGLRALARMNTVSLSGKFIAHEILRLVGRNPRPLRILDLGCGGGDILCRVATTLKSSGIRVTALGVDINEKSVAFAAKRARLNDSKAQFAVASAHDAVSQFPFDIAISSLFLHHLPEEHIIDLFRKIARHAEFGMVMNDLDRSAAGCCVAWLATRIFSRSSMVRSDGLTSVRGALIKSEMQRLAHSAKLHSCRVWGSFPCRLMVSWKREH